MNNGPSTHDSVHLPDKPALEGLSEKWDAKWGEEQVYAFDRNTTREEVYAIDTPPPTASGSLHVGHVFSYTHTDVMARRCVARSGTGTGIASNHSGLTSHWFTLIPVE